MKKVVVIVGPTAIGKTSLSIKLAKHYKTECISGDSVQVYRFLNIGSGKITDQEKEGIKHHLIDILEPTQSYSVSDFQTEARKIIDNLESLPLIVGGTGYYIKACLFDYDFKGNKGSHEFDNLTNEEIYNKLIELGDTDIPNVNNRIRLIRRLIVLSNGPKPTNKDIPLYDYLIIGLTCERDELYRRINNRVDEMVENGLIEEVKSLYDKGIRSFATRAIGYKELYDYFDGKIELSDAINLIKQHSRNFAKRQYTWFNNQMNVNWIDIERFDPYLKSIELIDEFIK